MTGKQAAEAGWRNLKHYRVPAIFVSLGACAATLASIYRELPDQTTLAGWCSAAWGAYLVYDEKRRIKAADELGNLLSERIWERIGGMAQRVESMEKRLEVQERDLHSLHAKVRVLGAE